MTKFLFPKKNILAACAAVALSFTALSPAYGLDKDTFIKRLQAPATKMSLQFSPDDVEIKDNNNVVIHNVIMHDPALSAMLDNDDEDEDEVQNKDRYKFALGDIYFDNISEQSDRYIVKNVRVSDFSKDLDDDKHIDIKGLSFENFILADKNEETPYSSFFYKNLFMKSLAYSFKGNVILNMNGLEARYDLPDNKAPIKFSSKVDNFVMDLKATTKDPETLEKLKKLELEKFSGRLSGNGSWDINGNGSFNLDELSVVADNIGTFKISYSFTGVTTSLLESMRKLQKEKAAGLSDEKFGLSALSLMQQLKIKNIKLHFSDNSFTNKLINFNAEKQGQTPDTMKEGIKGFTTFLAFQLKSPTFAKELDAAVKTFIDNPKSLDITAIPENDVSIGAIALVVAMGKDAPAKVIEMLNLHIAANQ